MDPTHTHSDPGRRPRVAFETFGCRLNQAETAIFTRQFMDRGWERVERAHEADLCVVHTCSLTRQATSKCRRLIRSIIRRNPDACVAAVGCYAQTGVEELQAIEGLDYIIGTADKMRIADIITSPDKVGETAVISGRPSRQGFTIDGAGLYPVHTRANLKVQEGCSFVCAFCIISRSRGPARSRDFDDVLREARVLAAEGHRELVLTGVNIGTYVDGTRTLTDIVHALEKVEGIDRIRMSSIEPTTIDDGIIDRMLDGTVMCPYLHIPLQSGDDGVLARMRRKYTSDEFRRYIDHVVARVPDIGLGTDVIVGFPGEGDGAFDNTARMIAGLPFNNVHVFSFSAREGTGAAAMDDSVAPAVVQKRSRQLHAIANTSKRKFYASRLGRTARVLFEERDSAGRWVGFTDDYIRVAVASSGDLSNRIASVRMVEVVEPSDGRTLVTAGELVEPEVSALSDSGSFATM